MEQRSIRAEHVVLTVACVATVVWGALAFGAVYPWAYVPLAAASALIGVTALVVERHGRPRITNLVIALSAIALAISLQIVPLPRVILDTVSPGTNAFLHEFDFSYYKAQAGDESTTSQD